MAKHRRAGEPVQVPPPRPVRDLLLWGAFGCALVPLALLWAGAGWRTALGVGGLLAAVGLVCAVVLRLSGLSLPGPADDDRQGSEQPPVG